MSSTAQRFASVAVAAALIAALSGCVGPNIESATEHVVAELEQLPGVASGTAVTAEPSFESQGSSQIRLVLDADIDATQLSDVVRRWSELIPSIPVGGELTAELPDGDRLEINEYAEVEAAVEESATWLGLSARTEEIDVRIIGSPDVGTWSDWDVVLGVSPAEFSAAIEGLRPELSERGSIWNFASADVDGFSVVLDAAVAFPSTEVLDVLSILAGFADPTVGRTALSVWVPSDPSDHLTIDFSLEPAEFSNIPSNEINDNIQGTLVEAFAFRLRDEFDPPAISTQLGVRVFSLDEFLTLDNGACAGQPGCTWTVVTG